MLSQCDKKYGVVPPLLSSKLLLLFLIGLINSLGSIMEYSSKLIKLSKDPDPGLISLVILHMLKRKTNIQIPLDGVYSIKKAKIGILKIYEKNIVKMM